MGTFSYILAQGGKNKEGGNGYYEVKIGFGVKIDILIKVLCN